MQDIKIAACISGQPRSFEKGYEYIYENLLSKYNVDVFFHTWFKEDTDYDKLKELYQPKDFLIELPLVDTFENYTRIPSPKFPAYFTVSAYYSIYRASRLREEQEINSNFKYDWVVKLRFDYALNGIPDFSLDNTKLYVPNCRMVPERDFCNDQFAFGSSSTMTKYCSTYPNLDTFYNDGVVMIGEDMLQATLRKYDLIGDNLVYVDVNNPFPPGEHNGTWHSLIRDDYVNWTAKK